MPKGSIKPRENKFCFKRCLVVARDTLFVTFFGAVTLIDAQTDQELEPTFIRANANLLQPPEWDWYNRPGMKWDLANLLWSENLMMPWTAATAPEIV